MYTSHTFNCTSFPTQTLKFVKTSHEIHVRGYEGIWWVMQGTRRAGAKGYMKI